MESVTLTLITQLVFGESVPFENEIEVFPALGEKVGLPHPLVEAAGGFATTTVLGKVSVKFTPVMETAPEFGISIVKVDVPPGVIVSGTNDFENVTEEGSKMYAKRALVS